MLYFIKKINSTVLMRERERERERVLRYLFIYWVIMWVGNNYWSVYGKLFEQVNDA